VFSYGAAWMAFFCQNMLEIASVPGVFDTRNVPRVAFLIAYVHGYDCLSTKSAITCFRKVVMKRSSRACPSKKGQADSPLARGTDRRCIMWAAGQPGFLSNSDRQE
jgi:hypothetical protein